MTIKTICSLVCIIGIAALPARGNNRQFRLDNVYLEADRTQLNPSDGSVTATGNISVTSSGMVLTADRITLNLNKEQLIIYPPFVLLLDNLELSGNKGTLDGRQQKLTIDNLNAVSTEASTRISLKSEKLTCESGLCTLNNVQGTSCPHDPTGFHIEAKKVTYHPSGDMDLRRPVFYLGHTPIAILPWIRLRPPNKPGFLAPRIAWDANGGFILGPRGYAPVGRHGHATAHIAVRTSQGFESSFTLDTPQVTLDANYFFDGTHHSRIDSTLSPPISYGQLKIQTDLVTDKQIVNDLSFLASQRATTHTQSQLNLSFANPNGTFENHVRYVQALSTKGYIDRSRQGAIIQLSGMLTPIFTRSRVAPTLRGNVERTLWSHEHRLNGPTTPPIPPYTQFTLTPMLTTPLILGILRWTSHIGTSHQLWLPDRSTSNISQHAIGLSTLLELPIIGQPGGKRHQLTFQTGYQVSPWIWGETPSWYADDRDTLESGHAFKVGILNEFGGSALVPAVTFGVIDKIVPKGFDSYSTQESYVHLWAAATPSFFKLDFDLSFDHRYPIPSYANIHLGSYDQFGTGITTGGRYYGKGNGPHVDRWSLHMEPWHYGTIVLPEVDVLELYESFSARFTDFLFGHVGVRIGILPSVALHSVYYKLAFTSRCQCLTFGVQASHRPNTPIPDMQAVFTLNGH